MSRKQRINHALLQELKPDTLIIEDESHRHSVPEGAESHFKITAVGKIFEPLSRIARHRLVNAVVADEFSQGLHALSLHLYTPNEWLKQQAITSDSPACRGGSHHG